MGLFGTQAPLSFSYWFLLVALGARNTKLKKKIIFKHITFGSQLLK